MMIVDRLTGLRVLARGILYWETLWPAIMPALCIAGLFTALALMEAPPALPGPWHAGLLALFAALLGGALWHGFRRWRSPDGAAARRRLERDSDLPHRPLRTLEDRLANSHDHTAAALWRAHRLRASGQLANLRLGLPRPGMTRRDPWALRGGVFLLLAVGLFVGWAEAPARLARALTPDLRPPAPDLAVLEAWINPPDYTALPPLKLSAERDGDLRIPRGSTLLAHVFGGGGAPTLLIDEGAVPFKSIDARNHELKQRIDDGQRLTISQDGEPLASWKLSIIADGAPTITAEGDPQVTPRQALRLSYQASDDYGLSKVWAEIRLADGAKEGEAPLQLQLPLSPPGARKARDAGFFDLTPHPWAGLPVLLRLAAADAIGQIGHGTDIALTLPERQFHHPVARAIIEQRRILTRTPEQRSLVATALRAIGSAPETYGDDQVAYLALRMAARRLELDKSEEAAKDVQALLWETALRIEDGEMSIAERALRAAQQALMEALSKDTSDQEIDRLMKELQQAMDRYLQALAEQARRNAQAQGEPQQIDPNARIVDADELRKMMDRIRELSRLGAKEAAREMLRQLQEMMENLDSRRMMAMPSQQQPGARALRELGELMQRQQNLLDRTFRRTPRRPGSPSQRRLGRERGRGQARSQQSMQGLAGEQEALRRQLGEAMRQLGETMGQIPNALGGADQSMRDAGQAMQRGNADQAVSSQTDAIDRMAEGFRELAEQFMQQPDRDEPGSGFGMRQEDPAGRPFQGGGMDTSRVMVPDIGDIQRARRILDELRRRAGDRQRPRPELDYIDRLLRRF